MKKILLIVALLVCTVASATTRSSTQVYRFRSAHPCPANHSLHGACPGYVVDHVIALECGGPDLPSNMQWQTVKAAKRKDIQERKCRIKAAK